MNIEVHNLIEEHISKWLDVIFHKAPESQTPAALVVFDSIAKLFRFGGYNKAFENIFGEEELSQLIRTGMDLEEEGLIPYAITKFKDISNRTWAYAIDLLQKSLLEADITNGTILINHWVKVSAEECTPGDQILKFIDNLVTRLGNEAKGKHLVLIPFSALKSEEGLVLVASIEDDLSMPHLPKLLDFLKSQGVLLSAYQNILRVEIEQGNSEGYRRLARLIKHEENGFIETFEALVADLREITPDELNKMGVDAQRLDFLENRMEGKKQLSEEMKGDDPINIISNTILYSRNTHLINQVPTMIEDAERVFKTEELQTIKFSFGAGARQDPLIRLHPSIIDRIIRNAVKNSFGISEEGQAVTVEVFVDVITEADRTYLELRIADDAGGLKGLASDIPRKITPQIWTVFCSQRPDLVCPEDGVGFWAISRYAHSSGGKFSLEDVIGPNDEVIGLCCHILLGLGATPEEFEDDFEE